MKYVFLALVSACSCVSGFLPAFETNDPLLARDSKALVERSPASFFINPDGTLTSHVIRLLKLDNLYNEGDDLSTVVAKTQKAWVQARQGLNNIERSDLKDDASHASMRDQVEECAADMGLFATRPPLLKEYTYGVCHGAFLDGVRQNLFQLVAAWKKGVRFHSLIFLTGERYLRKGPGEQDCIEKLCTEDPSLLPFKKGWRFPERVPYETEYDMVKLVFDQVVLPDDMREALEGKIIFVNAPKGMHNRPSTKDAFKVWLQEYNPQPGTVLACSYPLLWSYQQLAGETVLQNTGLFLDTAAPSLSEQEKTWQKERMVSLVFDTVAKCLYECSLKANAQPKPL